jgi:pantoate--beta-alanine ligase
MTDGSEVTAAPILARDRGELAAALRSLTGRRAVVMTMGALHEGHLALVRAARERADHVVVTIFVNPLQFGPSEDLASYPRDLDGDCALLASVGADLVFAPSPEVVYPAGDPMVRVVAGQIETVLEGAIRPGHFSGVLTVVLKLIHLVSPDLAFFGQKDAQQLIAVRRMVRDLDVPVEVVSVPTVRDADGLALSSRNAYLTPEQRAHALALSKALGAGLMAASNGADAVRAAARAVLDREPSVALDYVALIDPTSAHEVADGYRGDAILAVAARVGRTRLIDNTPLVVNGTGGTS